MQEEQPHQGAAAAAAKSLPVPTKKSEQPQQQTRWTTPTHSPNSTLLLLNATRSAAIPIHHTSLQQQQRDVEDHQEQQEIAEYKDYLFFSRVVQGISSNSSRHTQASSSSLPEATQKCLASLHRTRQGIEASSSTTGSRMVHYYSTELQGYPTTMSTTDSFGYWMQPHQERWSDPVDVDGDEGQHSEVFDFEL